MTIAAMKPKDRSAARTFKRRVTISIVASSIWPPYIGDLHGRSRNVSNRYETVIGNESGCQAKNFSLGMQLLGGESIRGGAAETLTQHHVWCTSPTLKFRSVFAETTNSKFASLAAAPKTKNKI